jgi:uncharacterized protein
MKTLMVLAELVVLLMLPLPFLDLNTLYVIIALIIMVLSKIMLKEKWSFYGFKAIRVSYLFIAIAIGIVFGYVDNFFIEPLMTKWIGVEPDLSTFEGVKGNVAGLIAFLAIAWVVGGLFEEFFFRGYIFYRLSTIIRSRFWHKFIAISITSVVFAFAHTYQGIAGIIDTFYFAIIMGVLYFVFRRNIWYLIMIHGFYDTVGIIKLYLGK